MRRGQGWGPVNASAVARPCTRHQSLAAGLQGAATWCEHTARSELATKTYGNTVPDQGMMIARQVDWCALRTTIGGYLVVSFDVQTPKLCVPQSRVNTTAQACMGGCVYTYEPHTRQDPETPTVKPRADCHTRNWRHGWSEERLGSAHTQRCGSSHRTITTSAARHQHTHPPDPYAPGPGLTLRALRGLRDPTPNEAARVDRGEGTL